jgi:hypothetical protein
MREVRASQRIQSGVIVQTSDLPVRYVQRSPSPGRAFYEK